MACLWDELRVALQEKSASGVAAEEIEARAPHAWAFLAKFFLPPEDVRPLDRRDLREGLLDHRDRTSAPRASPRSDRRFSRPPSVNPAAPLYFLRRDFTTTQLNAVPRDSSSTRRETRAGHDRFNAARRQPPLAHYCSIIRNRRTKRNTVMYQIRDFFTSRKRKGALLDAPSCIILTFSY